ncbi:MAG: hypothetical protein ABSH29_26405 [Acidimicrobiales bacterium]
MAAAQAAATETIEHWRSRLSESAFDRLGAALDTLAEPGQLRPTW